MQKTKRKFKTTTINTLDGKKIRIVKAEVADVQEQYTFGGGIDTVVIMKSDYQYIVAMTKQQVLAKLTNRKE